MLISDEYLKLNKELHVSDKDFGTSTSSRYMFDLVFRFYKAEGCQTVLDYGCGKGMLKRTTFPHALEYDPAIPGKDADPPPCDLVVCMDVLEHIEPESLGEVLEHIASKMEVCGFFTVATRPAIRILADGRNAHLIVKPVWWWMEQISNHFKIIGYSGNTEAAHIIVRKP